MMGGEIIRENGAYNGRENKRRPTVPPGYTVFSPYHCICAQRVCTGWREKKKPSCQKSLKRKGGGGGEENCLIDSRHLTQNQSEK